jgi:hypothetical protein
VQLSISEAIEEVRAMIADRNNSSRQRAALEMLLRVAQRGRHLSSTRLPSVITALQLLVKAQEALQEGLAGTGRSAFVRAQEHLQGGLTGLSGPGPEPEDRDER